MRTKKKGFCSLSAHAHEQKKTACTHVFRFPHRTLFFFLSERIHRQPKITVCHTYPHPKRGGGRTSDTTRRVKKRQARAGKKKLSIDSSFFWVSDSVLCIIVGTNTHNTCIRIKLHTHTKMPRNTQKTMFSVSPENKHGFDTFGKKHPLMRNGFSF